MWGFANGVCNPLVPIVVGDLWSDRVPIAPVFTVECSVLDSTGRGNCDVDMNECASSPCAHGAACYESRGCSGQGPAQEEPCAVV